MDKEPIRTIQPVVIPAQFFLWGPIVAGFLAIFPAVFALILTNVIGTTSGSPFDRLESGPSFGPGLVVYGLAFATILALVGAKVWVEPGQSEYAIFPDRVELNDGLFNRSRRTLPWTQVINVQLSESLLQRPQGAGTIILVTRQLTRDEEGRMWNQKITLRNVPHPRDVYDLVRSLVLKGEGHDA